MNDCAVNFYTGAKGAQAYRGKVQATTGEMLFSSASGNPIKLQVGNDGGTLAYQISGDGAEHNFGSRL